MLLPSLLLSVFLCSGVGSLPFSTERKCSSDEENCPVATRSALYSILEVFDANSIYPSDEDDVLDAKSHGEEAEVGEHREVVEKTFKDLRLNAPFCGQRPLGGLDQRIVGGKEATKGQFPWQAQVHIQNSDGHFRFQCGGTLVSERIVITAGHCIKKKEPEKYLIILGKQRSDLEEDECEQQVFDVERFEVHPDFSRSHLMNDVAVLWITTKYGQGAHFNDVVQPACLPWRDEDPNLYYKEGLRGTVSGWGLLDEKDRSISKTFQFVEVPLTSDDTCKDAYKKYLDINSDLQFCAGNDKGQDACAGDSGGPFVRQMPDSSFYLVGIVSFGKGCARPEYPGVYVKVHSYIDWILDVVGATDVVPFSKTSAHSAPLDDQKEASASKPTTTTTTSTTTTKATTTTSTTATTTTESPPRRDGEDGGYPAKMETVGPLCDRDLRLIKCPYPKRIKVYTAEYSNSRVTRCTPSDDDPPCSHPTALRDVQTRCDRNRHCFIHRNVFSKTKDPCPGARRFFEISYDCI